MHTYPVVPSPSSSAGQQGPRGCRSDAPGAPNVSRPVSRAPGLQNQAESAVLSPPTGCKTLAGEPSTIEPQMHIPLKWSNLPYNDSYCRVIWTTRTLNKQMMLLARPTSLGQSQGLLDCKIRPKAPSYLRRRAAKPSRPVQDPIAGARRPFSGQFREASLLLKLHRPGIEPGPPAWQASILPLNHRCLLGKIPQNQK